MDGTLGAGGHAFGILDASSPDGKLLGMDLDPVALKTAAERLAPFSGRTILRQASYADLSQELAQAGWGSVDGILLDLGLSSMQLDTPDRGFSFRAEAALDMRFDPDAAQSAADIVNHAGEGALADILYEYGEERYARRIARAIVNARPLATTSQLAEVVSRAVRTAQGKGRSGSRPGRNPATRTFQALRIAVNRELDALGSVLPQALAALKTDGRLVVISYHSLEDRIVKEFFRQESKDCICPPRQPVCTCGHQAQVTEFSRKPIRPQIEEVDRNPRSRSARMRAVEKI